MYQLTFLSSPRFFTPTCPRLSPPLLRHASLPFFHLVSMPCRHNILSSPPLPCKLTFLSSPFDARPTYLSLLIFHYPANLPYFRHHLSHTHLPFIFNAMQTYLSFVTAFAVLTYLSPPSMPRKRTIHSSPSFRNQHILLSSPAITTLTYLTSVHFSFRSAWRWAFVVDTLLIKDIEYERNLFRTS